MDERLLKGSAVCILVYALWLQNSGVGSVVGQVGNDGQLPLLAVGGGHVLNAVEDGPIPENIIEDHRVTYSWATRFDSIRKHTQECFLRGSLLAFSIHRRREKFRSS